MLYLSFLSFKIMSNHIVVLSLEILDWSGLVNHGQPVIKQLETLFNCEESIITIYVAYLQMWLLDIHMVFSFLLCP